MIIVDFLFVFVVIFIFCARQGFCCTWHVNEYWASLILGYIGVGATKVISLLLPGLEFSSFLGQR